MTMTDEFITDTYSLPSIYVTAIRIKTLSWYSLRMYLCKSFFWQFYYTSQFFSSLFSALVCTWNALLNLWSQHFSNVSNLESLYNLFHRQFFCVSVNKVNYSYTYLLFYIISFLSRICINEILTFKTVIQGVYGLDFRV